MNSGDWINIHNEDSHKKKEAKHNQQPSEELIIQAAYDLGRKYPLLIPKMVQAMNEGLERAFKKMNHQCADTESALAMAVRQPRTCKKFVKEKLNPYKDKLFLNWDWYE